MKKTIFLIIVSILVLPTVADLWQAPSNGPLVHVSEQLSHNFTNAGPRRSITISLSQNNLTVTRGSMGSLVVHVKIISRSVPVNLVASGIPIGTDLTFSPSSGSNSFSSTLTISTTGDTPIGGNNVTIAAVGNGLEKSATLFLLVLPVTYDLTVVSAVAQPNATIGSVVRVSIAAASYGSMSETFRIDLLVNETMVAETSQITLLPLTDYAGELDWNTTGFAAGRYNVTVTIPPIPLETNLGRNSLSAGQILLEVSKSKPNPPSPVSGKPSSVLPYGPEITVVAAIAELIIIFLLLIRQSPKPPRRPRRSSGRP